MHVTFASLRQNPRYAAMYVLGELVETSLDADFPFYVTDLIAFAAQVIRPKAVEDGSASLAVLRSWELAVLSCRRFSTGEVAMDLLQRTVTHHPKTILVTGGRAHCRRCHEACIS